MMDAAEHNRVVFGGRRIAREYEKATGGTSFFLDAGEQNALADVAAHTRGTAILDVGVGSGRTVGLLRLISNDYTGVDYAPNMVDAFRRSNPGITVELADARDLHAFGTDQFGLVVFSNNGIDSVAHDDRQVILTNFARVIGDSGRIVFSTLNRGGRSYRETPWQWHRPGMQMRVSIRAFLHAGAHQLLHPLSFPRGVGNWLRWRRIAKDHGDWAQGPLKAHDFAPFVHFTTLVDLRRTCAAAGLTVERIYSQDGRVIDASVDTSDADNFTVVLRGLSSNSSGARSGSRRYDRAGI